MDSADFGANSIHVSGPGGEVAPAAFELRSGGRQVQVRYPPLVPGAYTLTLDRNELRDGAGNSLGPGLTSTTFETAHASVEWINPLGGLFRDPANWSTNAV